MAGRIWLAGRQFDTSAFVSNGRTVFLLSSSNLEWITIQHRSNLKTRWQLGLGLITQCYLQQQKPPWAFQPAVWGISCLVLLPSPCNDSACTYHSAIFVKSWIIARRWEQNQAGDSSNSRLKSSRRFLLLLIRRDESQPLVLPLKTLTLIKKLWETRGMTYELLLEIF